MDFIENAYKQIIESAAGTSHYMLVKTHCQLMRSFEDMSNILGDDYRLHETANCAENYALAVRRYLAKGSDDK